MLARTSVGGKLQRSETSRLGTVVEDEDQDIMESQFDAQLSSFVDSQQEFSLASSLVENHDFFNGISPANAANAYQQPQFAFSADQSR